jgi:hypothetical protein
MFHLKGHKAGGGYIAAHTTEISETNNKDFSSTRSILILTSNQSIIIITIIIIIIIMSAPNQPGSFKDDIRQKHYIAEFDQDGHPVYQAYKTETTLQESPYNNNPESSVIASANATYMGGVNSTL